MSDIETAKRFRSEEKYGQALEIMFSLLNESPKDADLNYQIGSTYDASERCDQAIPYYENALSFGLSSDRDGCFLALGSSLRAIGLYEEAKKVLKKGIEEFPSNEALKPFLAITLYNLGEYDQAIKLLMKTILTSSSDENILAYSRALEYYVEHLDDKLEPTI
jgi:tetratricopeptide (TPR) repeat protein